MIGTADEIKYINRDELTHCVIFANIIKEIRRENDTFFNDDEIYAMTAKAVEQEIAWSNHIIGDQIIGITPATIEQYTKFIANKRLKDLGLNPLYDGYDENPYKQLEKVADTNGEGNVKVISLKPTSLPTTNQPPSKAGTRFNPSEAHLSKQNR